MPNPSEALTKAEPEQRPFGVSPLPMRILCLESQPLRNLTCLPSGQGAGQRVKPKDRARKNENSTRHPGPGQAAYQGEAGSCGKPRAVVAARTNCWMRD